MFDYFSLIKDWALKSPQAEVCGFLHLDSRGGLIPVQAENIAPQPLDQWEIRHDEQLQAYHRTETLFGLFHSHTVDTEEFSEEDLRTSTRAQLPMLLYSLKTDKWNWTNPKSRQYEGRTFVVGIQDCMQLAVDYYRNEMGISVPFVPRKVGVIRAGVDNWKQLAEQAGLEIVSADDLQPKDWVLMSIDDDQQRCNHSGILLDGNLLLHQAWATRSCVSPFTGIWSQSAKLALRPKTLRVKK